ncbi:hypothetical protein ANO11243_078860 [Dothideomycetidae sp. 11243]|nr:hypothetical protein ANO11243_078860 [fungal sp. No.11243]
MSEKLSVGAPISRPSSLIGVFGLARVAVGLSCLIAPRFASSLYGIDAIPASNIVFRLFGVRDAVLGALLWQVQRNAAKVGADAHCAQRVKNLLYIGVFIDVVDVISSAVCLAEGNLSDRTTWMIGAGAVSFASLGGLGLMSLN